MVLTLTWKVLSPPQTHLCLCAQDVPALRDVLRKVDAESQGQLLLPDRHNAGQINILVDLYAHLLMFAKARQMSPEKTSTLVAMMKELHETSMSERRTRVSSYDLLRTLVVRHSVARPPYSAAIFDVEDVQDMDEYFLSTYYRHYKMYVYAFVPRQTATLRCVNAADWGDAPPHHLPALSTAIPVNEWKRKVEERERDKEEVQMEQQQQASQEYEEHRARQAGLNDPHYSDGIREQLQTIRQAVLTRSLDRFDLAEQRIAALEAKVEGMQSRPGSKGPKRR